MYVSCIHVWIMQGDMLSSSSYDMLSSCSYGLYKGSMYVLYIILQKQRSEEWEIVLVCA
jgi:hypothetical protein